MDRHQERYLQHQERKRKEIAGNLTKERFARYDDDLFTIMYNRKSRRTFNGKLTNYDKGAISTAIDYAPSSCNRKGVFAVFIENTEQIETIAANLVGGTGWADKANAMLLFMANTIAYKAPGEIEYMPYLDTGFIAQNVYLASEYLELSACFINPNIREENKEAFYREFVPEGHLFCGAMALGK